MIQTEITFSGERVQSVCDGKCEKAWGVNQRPSYKQSDDEDDIVWFADHELKDAPENPGTYEDGEGKPFHPIEHNKWCVRECERCSILKLNEEIMVKDWSKRIYNIKKK